MSTTYVLGAGASFAYGESRSGVRPPLAGGFFRAYADLDISGDFDVRVGDIVNFARDSRGIPPERFGEFNEDAEAFMAAVDAELRAHAAAIQKHGKQIEEKTFARFVHLNKVYDQMIFLLAQVLNEVQQGPPSQQYSKLAQLQGPRDAVITFNWDTLLDHALELNGSWKPDWGYGVGFRSVFEDGWRAVLEEPPHERRRPNYLKLHGSVNWLVNYVTRDLRDGSRGMVQEKTPEGALPICFVSGSKPYEAYGNRYREGYSRFTYFFPPNSEAGIPTMPLLVPPTKVKLYEEFAHILDPLWGAAEQALRESDEIVIVGFSFPQTDMRVREMLRTALSPKFRPTISIVNPSPDCVIEALVQDVGVPAQSVSWVADTFGQYLLLRDPPKGIKALTRSHFDSLRQPDHAPLVRMIAEEREWYADQAEYVLGILKHDNVDNDWGFVVLGRDTDGVFEWIDGADSIPNEDAARENLVDTMRRRAASGHHTFPQ